MRRLVTLAALVTLPVSLAAGEHWPSFLGGQRSGATAATLPTTWDAKTNVAWKLDIPGSGWSSPVIHGDRVFVTSAVSASKQPAARKGLYIEDLKGKPAEGDHEWQVHCVEAKTGKLLWTKTAFKGPMTQTIHIKNSLASETPVTDGKHVWAYFGNVGVACYDRDGKQVWAKRIDAVKTRMGWGTAASPAFADGKLFIVNDNEEKSYVVALDGLTGKEVWRTERAEKSNWGTPFVWKNQRRTELVTAGTDRVRSYDLDGKLLWELKGMSVISIPTPFAVGDMLYVSSGYVMDLLRKPVYGIKPGAAGDITLKANETSNEYIVWCQWQAGSYHPTPIVVDDLLYVLLDRGFLGCYEAKTGKEVYRKRLGGSAFTASPIAYGGKLFCVSEDGETFVVKAGREFELVGRNPLEEMTLASPALAGGSLFLRTQSKLYCLRQAEGK